ncbi:MAG: S1C family serine protease [Thermoguttaceae bacterium]
MENDDREVRVDGHDVNTSAKHDAPSTARVDREQMLQQLDAVRRDFYAKRLQYWMLALILLLAIVALPMIAERWAYSTQRGAERAKYEAAKRFMAEHPESADKARIPYVVKLVGPSVVGIKTNTFRRGFFGATSISPGEGSGVIVDASGLIVTNFHVIAQDGRLVDTVEIVLSDGRSIPGPVTVIGFDQEIDLAVLKVEKKDLIPIEWGDSDALEVGDPVLALGNPYGLAKTVTEGIVSAKERFLVNERGVVSQEFLQTDAAVNPGNSGGALVNDRGQLVGINTAIYGGQYQGISFALPSRRVREVFDRIVRQARSVNAI